MGVAPAKPEERRPSPATHTLSASSGRRRSALCVCAGSARRPRRCRLGLLAPAEARTSCQKTQGAFQHLLWVSPLELPGKGPPKSGGFLTLGSEGIEACNK